MSYQLTLEQFENLNLFSNRNMEKVLAGIINSSSNAALVNMGEDSVIILDHKEGDFYISDYSFDRKKLVVEFTNFEKIELINESYEFENDLRNVFEDKEVDFRSLTESYKKNVAEKNEFMNDLVSFTMSRKSFDEDADYDEIKNALSEVYVESDGKQFFREYKERLETYPLCEVKRFDFTNPVKVSLIETERKNLVNESAIKKAHDLWKRESFKEKFEEASLAFVEDVDEGVNLYKKLFESYPQVLFLDSGDRKALFGKTILGIKNIREEMDDILKGLDLTFEDGDLKQLREEYLSENEDEGEDEEVEGESEEDYQDEEPEAEYEPAPEVESDDVTSIVADLTRIMNKCEDQKTRGKLEDLIDRLNESIEEGTRPALVKEAIAILTL